MLSYVLDSYIFSKKHLWKISTILEQTALSRQELVKDIETINQGLAARKIKLLEVKNDVLVIPEKVATLYEALRFSIKQSEFVVKESERTYLIYLLVFSTRPNLTLQDFQENLLVSKNTTINDIKRLREMLTGREICLKSSRKSGFYLEGSELAIRQFAWLALQKLQDETSYFVLSHFLNEENPLQLSALESWLTQLMSRLQLRQVQSRFIPVLFFSSFLLVRKESHTLSCDIPHLMNIDIFEEKSANQAENDYFLALMLANSDGELKSPELDFLYKLAFLIMENVMKLAAIEFEDFTKTFLALLSHLTSTYFRLLYHFEIENVLLERVKSEYPSLFPLMENALKPLAELTSDLPESELAYFVILFGGEIYKRKYSKNPRALVLCVNGISSSRIMKKRLESIFPTMEFASASSIGQLKEIDQNSYDLIFSTVPIPTGGKKYYLMSPLPSQEEEAGLYNQVLQDYSLPGFARTTAAKIYSAIEPYMSLKKSATKENVLRIIDKKLNNSTEKERISPMLSDLITNETIQFSDQLLNWEEAIEMAAQPLLRTGVIEESYPQAIISRVKEFGPYIDLGMGICLPHARPEDGVNQIGMTFLRCEKPVLLLDDPNHEVKLFVLLAAIDNEAHLKALSELTSILSNKEQLNQLLSATNSTEVMNILTDKERCEASPL
ncbi:MAG: PTS sugar transporter subunit IIA [Streptococcaceae bacterium]|jgi:transcriptional antiterminator/mannitol/fructose-specific phosphotransferase system IIA component (Ntr-type)|nr:PTS sugar transporter subunit IIA [Streptococcaceae bacterium]